MTLDFKYQSQMVMMVMMVVLQVMEAMIQLVVELEVLYRQETIPQVEMELHK